MKKQKYDLGNLHLNLSLDDILVILASLKANYEQLKYWIVEDSFGCDTDLDSLIEYLHRLVGGVKYGKN